MRTSSAGRWALPLLVALTFAALLLAACSASPTGTQVAAASLPDVVGQLLQQGPTGPTTLVQVDRVVDGDTIVVRVGPNTDRVRYIGMDTPETVKPGTPIEWMGPEASAANKRLVTGRTVLLEKDVSERDRYGRLLRDVWIRDGDRWTLVNLQLVLDGFAQVTTYPPDVKYVDDLLAVQRVAMARSAGLWGATPPPS